MHDTCTADKSEATPVCQSGMGQPVFRREWGNRDSGMCGGIRASRGYHHARVRLLMSRPAEPCYSGLRPAGPHLDEVTPECRYGPCVCHDAVLACRCILQVDVMYVYYVAPLRLCIALVLDVLDWCWTCGAPDCGWVYQDE